MDEYLCLTVCSAPGELPAEFSTRLSRFWTHLLRQLPDTYAQVYAETTAFEPGQGTLQRSYLIESAAATVLERELQSAGLIHEPIDRDEVFSKYEATPSEWMQLAH